MNTKNSEKRVKATITATDRLGRRESITLMLESVIAKMLEEAANYTYPDGTPNSYLRLKLTELKENPGYLTPSQIRSINKFDKLIFFKFYKYELSIEVKW